MRIRSCPPALAAYRALRISIHGLLALSAATSAAGEVNSWSRIGPDADYWIISVALDRQNPDSIFAREWTDGRAILRSRDGGESWQRIPISVGPPEDHLALVDLATDPLVSNSLYALARGFAPLAEFFSSADSGETWSRRPAPELCFNEVDLAVDPFQPGQIFISGRREYAQTCETMCPSWRTDDVGETWDCIGPVEATYGLEHIFPSPFTPGLLLGIASGHIYRSTDSGDTWARVYASPDASGFPYVHDIAWATTESAYAATVGGGIHASLDAGLTWNQVTPSTDPDYPWSMGEIVVDPFAPQTIFALARTSLFDAPTRVLHSADGGVTWEARETGLSGQWLSDLVLDPVTPNRLYVSARETGLFAQDVQEPSGCAESGTQLCLGGGRFAVQSLWRDFDGNSGVGRAAPLTGDTGAFWFFEPENLELFVKELDGQGTNGAYWTFYGALSNVEFTLLATDTATGAKHGYFNPMGRFASLGDIESFPQKLWLSGGGATGPRRSIAASVAPGTALGEPGGTCMASSQILCLLGDRFAVTATWRDFEGNSGVAAAQPLTGDTGSFWFFAAGNHELAIKLIDGRDYNDAFWVFYASLSNVEFDVTVTDTSNGEVWSRTNPSGLFASGGDIEAFPSP